MPTHDLSGPDPLHGAGLPRPVLPLHGVTVLVVEDSRFASEALRLMCQHSGARMRRAENLAQARRHLAVWRPDAVIVDLGLPDGEGTDLIREILAPSGFGPAILATSGDPALRGAAFIAGAAGFLEKPVDSLAIFQAAILRLFPGAPPPPAVVEETPPPDRMALTDDLAHAAELLALPQGQVQRGYLTRFLSGLARAAGDLPLAQAAERAAAGEDGLKDLSALVQARIAGAPAPFGHTGLQTTAIGFGAWAIGGSWGEVTEGDARATLHATLDSGVTFLDTADVYGDGRSERLIRAVLAERPGPRPFVATKAGRRLDPHTAEGYGLANLEAFVDRSRENLGVDTLDLVQLHCPPTAVFYQPETFAALDSLMARGKIARYGVSVSTVEEGLKAIEFPGVVSVQIIHNIFRQRPAELFFPQALRRGVAVIVRVPLASGMLTGKMTADSRFAADDHRAFNRDGAAFDRGETFSGVPYDVALQAVDELRPLVPQGATMAQMALRWILMEQAVTVVIPGARNPDQARANAAADVLAPLPEATMQAARDIYARLIAPHVHQVW